MGQNIFGGPKSLLKKDCLKWKWRDIRPSKVTHTLNPGSAFTHPSAHTQQWTHTPWTHTQSSGQPVLQHPGSSWVFGVLLKGTSVVVTRVERAPVIHSPHLQFLLARDSNSQPLDYESNSLTIRQRLPRISEFSYPTFIVVLVFWEKCILMHYLECLLEWKAMLFYFELDRFIEGWMLVSLVMKTQVLNVTPHTQGSFLMFSLTYHTFIFGTFAVCKSIFGTQWKAEGRPVSLSALVCMIYQSS